jgi:transposase
MIQESHTWPPQHRCQNCGWWGRHWLVRFFFPKGEMGFCKHPQMEDATWRSYTCHRHTTSDRTGLQVSLNVLKNQQTILTRTLREKTDA